MKHFAILILALIPYFGISQTTSKTQFYLNGNKIDFYNIFINEKQIESINIKKDKPNGEIFITTKEIPWKYKTIDQLLDSLTLLTVSQFYNNSFIPVFIIDGKVVKDKADIKIDDSYLVKNVTINRLSDVSGIKGTCRNLMLVDISLTLFDPRKILLRGSGNPEIDSLMNLK